MVARFIKTKKRASWQTIFVSAILGILTLCLIVFLGVSNWNINAKRQKLNAEIEDLRRQAQILDERKQSLEAGLSQSQEADFQEEKIRDQGYKKPGEEVIAILQDKTPSKASEEHVEPSFWNNIWQKIKNLK